MESVPLQIAFWVLAAVTVGSALAVVLLRDLFRAALLLVLCFFAIAGIYITLHADFLAAVQVLIYIGAIAVLIIFAIMLTRELHRGSPSGRLRFPALAASLLMLMTLVFIVLGTDWLPQATPPQAPTTGALAEVLFNNFVLTFEVAAALLLAAIIGAIVITREK